MGGLTYRQFLVVFLMIIVLLSGCRHPSESDYEAELSTLVGERSEAGGKQILSYDAVEVADDIFMEKTVECTETAEGFDGTIILEFENKGSADGFTHIESIPKEFAESVDDLEFSVEPSRIIDPDPEVEWGLKFEGIRIIGIEVKAKGKAPVVELFDGFDKAKSFEFCKKAPDYMKDMCYLVAIQKLKKPSISDCDIISGLDIKDSCIASIAVIREDITICAEKVKTSSVRSMCYVTFALMEDDSSICDNIKEKPERMICQMAFEAKEKGITLEELQEQKLKELEGQEIDSKEDVVFDLYADTDDDELLTGRLYTFTASLDPVDMTPKNAVYEFVFNDGVKQNSSSSTFSRKFDKPGSYVVNCRIFDGKDAAYYKSRTYTVIKDEEESIEEEVTVFDCKPLADECVDSCNKICEQTKGEYCNKYNYSGCALDVFCWCNVCVIYDTKWCPYYPEFRGCAEGAKGKYRSCIENCQAKREAAQDVSTFWQECNTEFDEAVIECKQQPCKDFCSSKGFDNGEWARYTQEYGWDSCYCS